jgi:hypothetical protein
MAGSKNSKKRTALKIKNRTKATRYLTFVLFAVFFGLVGWFLHVLSSADTTTYSFTPSQLVSANDCGPQPTLLTDRSKQAGSYKNKSVLNLPAKTVASCENAPIALVNPVAFSKATAGHLGSDVKACVYARVSSGQGTLDIRLTGTANNVGQDVTVTTSYTKLCGFTATLQSLDGNLRLANRGSQTIYVSSVQYAVIAPVVAPTPTPTPTPTPAVTYGPVSQLAPANNFVTPEQYGAKGDGATDDTTAMQNALNGASGKTLWLPAGKTYKVSKTISVPSDTTVTGAGTTSVIKFTWQDATGTASGGGSNIRTKDTTSSNIHLSNFVLQGAGDGLPGGAKADNANGLVPLLKLIRLDNFTVTHMELRNAVGLSVSYSGCSNGVFQYNYVHNSGRDGITGYTDQAKATTSITVDNNKIEKVGDDGVAINGLVPGQNLSTSVGLAKNIKITNNIVIGWNPDPNGQYLGRGIQVDGVDGIVIKYNQISYPSSNGLLITGCTDHLCANMTIDWHNKNVDAEANLIDNANGSGSRPGAIYIYKTDDSTILGNTITNSTPTVTAESCTNCNVQSK